jgi:hypothetical protein
VDDGVAREALSGADAPRRPDPREQNAVRMPLTTRDRTAHRGDQLAVDLSSVG